MRSKIIKYVVAGAFTLSLIGTAGMVQASSLTQTQVSAIIGLLQSFGADATTIANVTASLHVQPANGNSDTYTNNGISDQNNTTSCVILPANLGVGSRGAQVSDLQRFLDVNPTGYFGLQTKAAVQNWQASHSISAIGYVGPATRRAMGCVVSSSTVITPTATIDQSSLITNSTNPTITGTFSGNSLYDLIISVINSGQTFPSQYDGPMAPFPHVLVGGPQQAPSGFIGATLINGRYTIQLSSFGDSSASLQPGTYTVGIYVSSHLITTATLTIKKKDGSVSYLGTQPPTKSQAAISVPGMTQYTDTDFGFSFWYPSSYNVRSIPETGEIIVSGSGNKIYIQKVTSSDLSYKIKATACGTCDKKTYYFDTVKHLWMFSRTDVLAGDYSPAWGGVPANISNNTMGGLHILKGQDKSLNVIIPLSARNFLSISDAAGWIGDPYEDAKLLGLTKTIVATDPSVATPVSIAEQNKIIQAEATVFARYYSYVNSQYGFSIAYPGDLTPETPGQSTNWYSSSQNKGVTAVHFGDPQNMSASAQMQVGFSNNSTDIANCLSLPDRSMQLVTDEGTITINGVSFKSFTVKDLALGNHYDEQWYKTVHDGSCWAIGSITQWNSHLSGTEATQEENELNQALWKLYTMAKSFRFTN